MPEHLLLAVDLGTSATKVVAVDRRLRTHVGVELANRLHATGDRAEQDPAQVLATAIEAVRQCVDACAGQPVAGLVFSAAMHTLLAVDTTGTPLTPALSWADNRATRTARQIRAEHGETLHRSTGTPVHPMSPLAKLAWFTSNGHHPTARWCGLKDYVVAELTGHLVIDQSCASATGLLDIERLTWHPPALAAAGIRPGQLPELVTPAHTGTLTPAAASALNLPAGLPVVTGAGDGPLANLGVGALTPGVAALSLGTSGALRVVTDRPGVDAGQRTFCYYLADGHWVVGGAVSNGGLVGRWAADRFGVDLAQLLTEAAATSSAGLIALPYLMGERAPSWDPDLTGAIIGLRHEHGRAEITRALLEGVAHQFALIRDAMNDSGAEVTTIRASGGALRSPVWTTVLAAALGTPLDVVTAGGSAVGAAALGWTALGEIASLPAAASAIASGMATERVEPRAEDVAKLAGARPLVEEWHRLLRRSSGHGGDT